MAALFVVFIVVICLYAGFKAVSSLMDTRNCNEIDVQQEIYELNHE